MKRRATHAKAPRRTSAVQGCRCLEADATIGACTKPGLQALEGPHHALMKNARAAACSVYLDRCFARSNALYGRIPDSQAPRWDYVLITRSDVCIGVEVHPGGDSHVDDMIAKRDWAESKLRAACPTALPHHWFWLTPPGAAFEFNPNTRRRRLLNEAGISNPARTLTLP